MPEPVHILRVVVASPADVKGERVVPRVVEDLNSGIAADRKLRLEVIRWETDSYPGFHPEGPQALIDTVLHIEDSDIVIGIFWKRFGTLTKAGTTGTEHEIRRSYEAWAERGHPQVMVYFKQKPSTPQSQEEAEQWGQVLKFRKDFPAEGLWWPYKSAGEFERLLRAHLTNFIRNKYQFGASGTEVKSAKAAPSESRTEAGISGMFKRQPLLDAQEAPSTGRSILELTFDDQQDGAKTLSSTDPSARTDRVYHASAYALSGKLTLPYSEVIKKQAFVALTDREGMFSQRARSYVLEGVVSYASAKAEVAGSVSSQARTTLATAVVEKLNLLDVVTADRVVAKISIDVPKDEDALPKVSFFGTRFESLCINGMPVDLRLQADVFAHDRTNSRQGQPRRGTLVTRMSSNLPCSRNSIALPGIGTLFLGELFLDEGSYQLSMVRLAASSGYCGLLTVATCQASVDFSPVPEETRV